MYDLIYVHPRCVQTGRDAIVPMGILTMVSALPYEKTGVFERELTDSLIGGARVFLMDIHWHFTLTTGMLLANRIRRINPGAKIIAGGYTASIFARQVVRNSEIDFVVRGDADHSLPELVAALLNGQDPRKIPNITAGDFETGLSGSFTTVDYSSIEFHEPAWFPSYMRIMKSYQKNRYPTYTYPFVPVARGCYFQCDPCYGNPRYQKMICGREAIFRDGAAIARDLARIEDTGWIRLAYMVGDLDSRPNRGNAEKAFSRKYRLNLYYEYFNIPDNGHLDMLCSSFDYVFACLFTTKYHQATNLVEDLDGMEEALSHARGKNINFTLFVNPDLEALNPGYAKRILDFRKKYGCELYNMKSYMVRLRTDIPMPSEDPVEIEEQFRYHYNKNSSDSFPLYFRRNLLQYSFTSSSLTLLARKMHTAMIEKDLRGKLGRG